MYKQQVLHRIWTQIKREAKNRTHLFKKGTPEKVGHSKSPLGMKRRPPAKMVAANSGANLRSSDTSPTYHVRYVFAKVCY
jgi:hypothetical protein